MNGGTGTRDATLAWPALAVCGVAAVATVALTLPGGYLRLRSAEEVCFLVVLIGPYLLLGLLAWRSRGDRRTSRGLLALVVLVALVGLYALGAEASDYRSAVRASPTGPEYMEDRYQRMAMFLVPVVQWPAALLAGVAVLVQGLAGRSGPHR